MKSALRYLGSKTKEAPWITAHFPPHKIYVEPFGGSAAVLLYKNPAPIEIYNGIKRIPPQSKTWADYPSTLHQIAAALERHNPEIHNAPWQEEIRKYDSPDTLIYLDPPYLHSTRKSRQRYCNELTEADHIELLHTIGHLRSKCIISGYDSPLYNQHLPTWTKITRQYPTQSSRKAEECLWLNYPPPGLLSLAPL